MTRWPPGGGADYAARFAALADTGKDMHGEVRFCSALTPPPARVLDAGCGTGRIAVELARRGYGCVGVDIDPSMLAEAERSAPDVPWVHADLATLTLPGEEPFDLVVCAGNVLPLLSAGTEPHVLSRLAGQLRPGGFLVTGFGLDRAHLPPSAAVLDLTDVDRWCTEAGLVLEMRHSTWDGDPWPGNGGYAVSVSRRI